MTDTRNPLIWRLPVGQAEIGEPEVAIDLAKFGPADPAYLNGIVAHPGGTRLLVASQGEGGTLWLAEPGTGAATPVDLGRYEFNADGMLVDGDVLYGVTNRGETDADTRFMISVARLAPDWRSGQILGEMTDPAWDCPTTIAKAGGEAAGGLLSGRAAANRRPAPPAFRSDRRRLSSVDLAACGQSPIRGQGA